MLEITIFTTNMDITFDVDMGIREDIYEGISDVLFKYLVLTVNLDQMTVLNYQQLSKVISGRSL